MLPGGRAFLFTLGSGDIPSWDDGSIAVLSLDTGQYEVLVEGGMNPKLQPFRAHRRRARRSTSMGPRIQSALRRPLMKGIRPVNR